MVFSSPLCVYCSSCRVLIPVLPGAMCLGGWRVGTWEVILALCLSGNSQCSKSLRQLCLHTLPVCPAKSLPSDSISYLLSHLHQPALVSPSLDSKLVEAWICLGPGFEKAYSHFWDWERIKLICLIWKNTFLPEVEGHSGWCQLFLNRFCTWCNCTEPTGAEVLPHRNSSKVQLLKAPGLLRPWQKPQGTWIRMFWSFGYSSSAYGLGGSLVPVK